jgi:hypothetical protein
MKFLHRASGIRNGFSYFELLIALGVMSVVGMVFLQLNDTTMKANKSNEFRSDLDEIKRIIVSKISCNDTLGPARPSTCSGTQVLKDKLGKDIAPGGKIGSWNIEAICEPIGKPARNGLSIYATRKRADGYFLVDPIRNLPWDRKHPSSSLFEAGTRICAESFGFPVVASCPYKIESINFEDRTVVCAKLNIAPCPPKEYLTGVVDDVRTCARAPICRAFSGRATGAGNQGGANSPNEDCANRGGVPGADWGGYIKAVTNRYCMSPHSTSKSYAQHGDCSNRGGKNKCGCWSCQADGVECYIP